MSITFSLLLISNVNLEQKQDLEKEGDLIRNVIQRGMVLNKTMIC